MKSLLHHLVLPFNLSKTLVYSTEYRILYGASRALSFFVQPPGRELNPKTIAHLKAGVIAIHKKDAENVRDGVYPIDVVIPRNALDHVRLFPKLLVDSLKISRRRKTKDNKDLSVPDEAPEYLNRNYHFQTDGYFSASSAAFYEQQVEILFSGTAAPMRRMLIAEVKKKMDSGAGPLRILEIGAGVGSATIDFARSFSFSQYVVSDVSSEYLARAKERVTAPGIDFVQAKVEDLPFAEGSFDLVFSVFLFHELPRPIRTKALTEMHRVLSPGGVLGICDSLQRNDDEALNTVLEAFPIDYHEPFYKDYTLWDASTALTAAGLKDLSVSTHLLSKYWVCKK